MSNAFDNISRQYKNKSLVQQKAAQKLLTLLKIQDQDKVLDVGCGPGHITNAIAQLTAQKVIGTDISAGMIQQAQKNYPNLEFRQIATEDLKYQNEFDVVFCNSTFQWFKNTEPATQAMYKALKTGGRIGIACPGTRQWSPLFLKIIPVVTQRPELAPIFKHWQSPWVFLPEQKAYQDFFEKQGFKTIYIKVDYEKTKYSTEDAYNIYLSGAANGFTNKSFYSIPITDEYIELFNRSVKAEIIKNSQAGRIYVDFNRFYYLGVK